MSSGYDERFKFIGKERDVESGYDFFGARSYCSPFKHWLSPDPLSDKDPGISPYAYCRWNPVRLVDPDGKESRLIINGHKITISANYYANAKDMNSLKQAISFWNSQSGLSYADNNGQIYSVNFELTIKQADNPYNAAALGDKYDNSYTVFNTLDFKTSVPNATATGGTKENKHIQILQDKSKGLTGKHEIGHTLMNMKGLQDEHAKQGIMTQFLNDSQRGEFVTQETINTIVNSHKNNPNNRSLWQKFLSIFE